MVHSHAVPPGNIHKTPDVRGDFSTSAQVLHGRRCGSRVRDHHRDDVAVFRREVFDHHVHVHEVRVEVPVGGLTWCFVVTTEIETEGIYGELLCQLLLVNIIFVAHGAVEK